MALVQQAETTVGPVAIDGHTITLVARTRALRLGRRGRGALHVRARPTHVEILDGDGRHNVVRIRDLETALIAAIVATGAALAIGTRFAMRGRNR
jgi:hypothetical protein